MPGDLWQISESIDCLKLWYGMDTKLFLSIFHSDIQQTCGLKAVLAMITNIMIFLGVTLCNFLGGYFLPSSIA